MTAPARHGKDKKRFLLRGRLEPSKVLKAPHVGHEELFGRVKLLPKFFDSLGGLWAEETQFYNVI
jgi:hypothetical protein